MDGSCAMCETNFNRKRSTSDGLPLLIEHQKEDDTGVRCCNKDQTALPYRSRYVSAARN